MKSKNLKYLYLFFLLQIYFIGFFFRENIGGGAESDFNNFTWPVILSFKENFFETLKNYGVFGEGSPPLFHILNAYLNPFIFSKLAFQGSITIFSLFNVLIFSKILEDKFFLSKSDSFLYGSIFLILPFFRSSSFWGLTENLGWLFLLLSIKIYLDLNKYKNKILSIFLLTLFSSLALYTRPYLIFFPVFLILKTITEKNYFLFNRLSFFYLIMAIPGLYLIYLWGGSFVLGSDETKISFIQEYHSPRFIIKNLVFFSSIFLFYIIPLEFIFFLKEKKLPSKKSFLTFLTFFSLLLVLHFFGFFDYLYQTNLGGGVFFKVVQIFLQNQMILFLFISALGFSVIFKYLILSNTNKILFFSLIIFCFPKFILQEYFEPLMIILFFSIFDFKDKFFKLNDNKNIIVFLSYFIAYFSGSYYFRYFY